MRYYLRNFSVFILILMTIWRGYQRFVFRKDFGRQVSWAYLLSGTIILLVMGLHGSLGAWLASDFGVHITADQLLVNGVELKNNIKNLKLFGDFK